MFVWCAVGTKFRASSLEPEEVRAYRELERQDLEKVLDVYLAICHRMGVCFLIVFVSHVMLVSYW